MSSNQGESMNNYREREKMIRSSDETETTSSSLSSGEDSQDTLKVLASASTEYFIQSYVGEGTFGQVAKCIKASTKETVAVKMLKESGMTLNVKNEMAILEYLKGFDSDKFNYITYREGFTHKNRVCLEFEMLDMSLLNFCRRKPNHRLDLKEIRPILYQVATTLQFLKSRGIIHSDLKPDNIMLVDHVNCPLRVKVIDFGLARHASQSQSGSYIQTRHYRSPEVIIGSPHTAAIDMWSLGCIAAEMFLGYVLYPGQSEYDMLQHIVRTQGQPPVRLLSNGLKTSWFFRKRNRRQRKWRLKTPCDYGRLCTDNYFNCLDDLRRMRPGCHLLKEDNMAEIEDREDFIDLLKKMLHLDAEKRILPSHIFEEPFITMTDLADSFHDSSYLKTSRKMMEVCQDRDVNRDQQPRLSPQPSTSTASPDQHVTNKATGPVGQSDEQNPLDLGIASSISERLAVHGAWSASPPQQVSFSVFEKGTHTETQSRTSESLHHKKKKKRNARPSHSDKSVQTALPEENREKLEFSFKRFKGMPTCGSTGLLRRPLVKAVVYKGWGRRRQSGVIEKKEDRKATVRKLLQDSGQARSEDLPPSFRASHGVRSEDGSSPKPLHESNKAPTEAQASEAKVTQRRKRSWATFTASHRAACISPDSSSPERKRMKMTLPNEPTETPPEAKASEAKVTLRRKRSWATFTASHSAARISPDSSSPERKRMRMSLLHESNKAPTEAQSSEATVTPRRKRSWATFTASHRAACISPDSSSPERKRMKMTLPNEPPEIPPEAKASEAKVNSRRKRSWGTFTASHIPSRRSPDSSTPEKKRRKMTLLQDPNEAPPEVEADELHKYGCKKVRKKSKS